MTVADGEMVKVIGIRFVNVEPIGIVTAIVAAAELITAPPICVFDN